jgi:hypothetical protein
MLQMYDMMYIFPLSTIIVWMILYICNSTEKNGTFMLYNLKYLIRNCWNYLKFCGVIQLSAIFGCAQVKIFMGNVYTKPRVCTQEK